MVNSIPRVGAVVYQEQDDAGPSRRVYIPLRLADNDVQPWQLWRAQRLDGKPSSSRVTPGFQAHQHDRHRMWRSVYLDTDLLGGPDGVPLDQAGIPRPPVVVTVASSLSRVDADSPFPVLNAQRPHSSPLPSGEVTLPWLSPKTVLTIAEDATRGPVYNGRPGGGRRLHRQFPIERHRSRARRFGRPATSSRRVVASSDLTGCGGERQPTLFFATAPGKALWVHGVGFELPRRH